MDAGGWEGRKAERAGRGWESRFELQGVHLQDAHLVGPLGHAHVGVGDGDGSHHLRREGLISGERRGWREGLMAGQMWVGRHAQAGRHPGSQPGTTVAGQPGSAATGRQVAC